MDETLKPLVKTLLAAGLQSQISLARRRVKAGKWQASGAALFIADYQRAYDAAVALLDGPAVVRRGTTHIG